MIRLERRGYLGTSKSIFYVASISNHSRTDVIKLVAANCNSIPSEKFPRNSSFLQMPIRPFYSFSYRAGGSEPLTVRSISFNNRGFALSFSDAAPQLLYKFIEQTMQPGPSVSLKCIAMGNPTPHFSWTLDGFPLPQNDR